MPTNPVIKQGTAALLDVLGPTVEMLTSPDPDLRYCVMRGTIPPGVSVPLHSHPDAESFFQLAGSVEVCVQQDGRPLWHTVEPGDFVHIAGNVPHAWRNAGASPAIGVIATTHELGQFFREVGRPAPEPAGPSPITAAVLEKFTQAGLRRGHWFGSPEENRAAGIDLPPT